MYKCIACLSYNIKKVKTARLTQKQIAKDSQAIPPPPKTKFDEVLYDVNIKLPPGFTVFISHYFFLTKILHCQNF